MCPDVEVCLDVREPIELGTNAQRPTLMPSLWAQPMAAQVDNHGGGSDHPHIDVSNTVLCYMALPKVAAAAT
jgi:hypothetical protein